MRTAPDFGKTREEAVAWYSLRFSLAVQVCTIAATLVLVWQLELGLSDGRALVTALGAIAVTAILIHVVHSRFRLSLRAFFVLFTLVAVLLGSYSARSTQVLKRDQSVRRLEALGGSVRYENVERHDWNGRLLPTWLQRLSADRIFGRVSGVVLPERLNDTDLERVANAFTELKDLQVSHTQITDSGLKHLVGMHRLEHLLVTGDQLSAEGVENLRRLPKLQHLICWMTEVNAESIGHLRRLPHLKSLEFYDTVIADGLQTLPNIERLWIRDSTVNDSEFQYLQRVQALNELFLENMTISDAAVLHLSELSQLSALQLSRTAITVDGVRQLKASLPHCKVYCFNLQSTSP